MTLKLNKMYINGLFGEFDYLLDFGAISDNVIILTAPNGYGKSTILKILDKFFNKRFDSLLDESFNFFELEFDDIKIKVEKTDDTLRIFYNNEDFSIKRSDFLENNKRFRYVLKTDLPFMSRFHNNKWIDDRDGEILSTKELIERYKFMFGELSEEIKYDEKLLGLLDKNVFFVETNRLVDSGFLKNSSENSENSAIKNLSGNIIQLINEVKEAQYDISMDQSSDFPTRVMSLLSDNVAVDVSEVIEEVINITRFDKTYNENEIFGNLKLDSKIIGKLKNEGIYNNKSFLLVLSSYLKDFMHRVNHCSDLAKRIHLFKNSVNSLLQFKNIDIHPIYGLIVQKKPKNSKSNKTDEFNKIDKSYSGDFSIDLLSSGEQHLIILLGNLIFNTKFGTLILIDEPEISLHAAWQKKLLSLISEIANINKFNILIATHSFTLINGNWDNTIELAELLK